MKMSKNVLVTIKVALLLVLPVGLAAAAVVATPSSAHANEMKGG